MLVHHLRHGVAQQDDVLVERLDIALQLDAIDEVDGNRHVLFAQRVQNGSCSNCPLLLMAHSKFIDLVMDHGDESPRFKSVGAKRARKRSKRYQAGINAQGFPLP
jgi:hypothetical protein